MQPQLRTHSALNPLNSALPPSPASTKSSFIPRGLGNAYRRIGAKLRQSRSMDMTQQLAVLSLANTEGRALGSNHINHTPRSNSPASTHSGSSPGTSQGKASMDIERNTRPVPDKFTRSASRELFLNSPNRRMASIPLPLPSHLDLDRPYRRLFRTILTRTLPSLAFKRAREAPNLPAALSLAHPVRRQLPPALRQLTQLRNRPRNPNHLMHYHSHISCPLPRISLLTRDYIRRLNNLRRV
ncbi:hypothetical protein BJV77DRAFT_674612 [Russula vinacea]|nr:hypothetical protein BJV77DRAFT_674612 [Russula vinacea]